MAGADELACSQTSSICGGVNFHTPVCNLPYTKYRKIRLLPSHLTHNLDRSNRLDRRLSSFPLSHGLDTPPLSISRTIYARARLATNTIYTYLKYHFSLTHSNAPDALGGQWIDDRGLSTQVSQAFLWYVCDRRYTPLFLIKWVIWVMDAKMYIVYSGVVLCMGYLVHTRLWIYAWR